MRSYTRWAGVVAATLLAVAAAAAGCEEDTDGGGSGGILGDLVEKETVRIQADQGGEVPLSQTGGNASFQANTLSADTDVTNAAYEAGEPIEEEAVSFVFNVTTSTAVGLNGTYRITVPYDARRLGERRVIRLRHQAYQPSEEAGGEPRPVGEVVDVPEFNNDTENFVVTADVTSFGAYWVAAFSGAGLPDAGPREPDVGRDVVPDAGGATVADAAREVVPDAKPPEGERFDASR